MKTCPACLHQNSDNAGSCESCGHVFDSALNSKQTRALPSRIEDFTPGSMLADRFQIVKVLGAGGMGAVYLVQDTRLQNREVALKMIHPRLVENPEARQRFEQEVILCLDLLHPNIVRVHHLEEWQGLQFFTMEYIPGQSLRQLIEERKKNKPPFSLPEVVAINNPLLEALSYAHQFTIHRDIKPENIIITGDLPDVSLKVLDFGIARTLSASRFTETARAMGTAYYMAPEQMAGGAVDHRADLYSVGMVLYELLTGKVAVGIPKMPSALNPDLPVQIDDIITRLLEQSPDGRYANAGEVQKDLSNAVSAFLESLEEREQHRAIKELLETGQAAYKEQRWSEAEQVFKLVLEIDGENKQANELLDKIGEIRARMDQLERAAEQAESSGDIEKAVSLLEKLIAFSEDRKTVAQRKSQLDQLLENKRREELERQREEEEEERLRVELREEREKREAERLRQAEEEQSRQEQQRIEAERKQQEEERRTAAKKARSKRSVRIGVFAVAALLLVAGIGYFINKGEQKPESSKIPLDLVESAPVATTGHLFVEVDPKDALIRIIDIQRAYRRGMELEEGQYHIEVSHADYKVQKKWVTIKAGEDNYFSINLERKIITGRLYVDTLPEGARIRVLNIKLAYRPGMKLEGGSYHIEVSHPGFETEKTWVEIKTGETTKIRIELKEVSKRPAAGQILEGSLPDMEFAYIPPGTFMMGSPSSEKRREEDERQHRVTLTKEFYIQTTEVTVGQWREFVGATGYKTEAETGDGAYVWTGSKWEKKPGTFWDNPGYSQNENHPVSCVSWNDIQKFIRWLNSKEGSSRYRLPKEAEWEYAARAGSAAAFTNGDITETGCGYDSNLHELGWYCGNAGGKTHPVARKQPNAWGLYDMHGNVWEWCQDWHGKYPSGSVTDPRGPSSGSYRVNRGGSWRDSARHCRTADRGGFGPGGGCDSLGFRLARDP